MGYDAKTGGWKDYIHLIRFRDYAIPRSGTDLLIYDIPECDVRVRGITRYSEPDVDGM